MRLKRLLFRLKVETGCYWLLLKSSIKRMFRRISLLFKGLAWLSSGAEIVVLKKIACKECGKYHLRGIFVFPVYHIPSHRFICSKCFFKMITDYKGFENDERLISATKKNGRISHSRKPRQKNLG